MSEGTDRETQIAYEQFMGDMETLHRLVFTRNTPVRESDIRASVSILRRWLCHPQLPPLCNRLGVKPTFLVEDNSAQAAAVEWTRASTTF